MNNLKLLPVLMLSVLTFGADGGEKDYKLLPIDPEVFELSLSKAVTHTGAPKHLIKKAGVRDHSYLVRLDSKLRISGKHISTGGRRVDSKLSVSYFVPITPINMPELFKMLNQEGVLLKDLDNRFGTFSKSEIVFGLKKTWDLWVQDDKKRSYPIRVEAHFGRHEKGKANTAKLIAAYVWVGVLKEAKQKR